MQLAPAPEFLDLFARFEHGLKRCGFLYKDKKRAEAHWGDFADSLGEDFFRYVRDSRSAATLIDEPPRKLMREGLNWLPDKPDALTDVRELFVRGVCQVRNNLIHGEKYANRTEDAARNEELVSQAKWVLEQAMARHGKLNQFFQS